MYAETTRQWEWNHLPAFIAFTLGRSSKGTLHNKMYLKQSRHFKMMICSSSKKNNSNKSTKNLERKDNVFQGER
jgi:hypothetical protein